MTSYFQIRFLGLLDVARKNDIIGLLSENWSRQSPFMVKFINFEIELF